MHIIPCVTDIPSIPKQLKQSVGCCTNTTRRGCLVGHSTSGMCSSTTTPTTPKSVTKKHSSAMQRGCTFLRKEWKWSAIGAEGEEKLPHTSTSPKTARNAKSVTRWRRCLGGKDEA